MNSNIKDADLIRYYQTEFGSEYHNKLKSGLNLSPDDLRKRFNIHRESKTALTNVQFKTKMHEYYRKFVYFVKLIGAARAAGELSRMGYNEEAKNLMLSIREQEKDK